MSKKHIIGVDIGGSNTDGVLIDEKKSIIASAKTMTFENLSDGFYNVLKEILTKSRIKVSDVGGVFVGTTHATNAILEAQDLYKVGVLRIAGQNPEVLPSGYTWPEQLRTKVICGSETINGGVECDGRPITLFDEEEAENAIVSLLKKGAQSIAIIGVFSSLDSRQELKVAEMTRKITSECFPISISSEIGGIGFIERENSTILNSALKKVMQKGFCSLKEKCLKLELKCPLMITQNDGSLMSLEKAMQYPILTISAGPTNSFIGATRLTNHDRAVVVDIGGTSTDVGLVCKGFPVRSLNGSNIGGISLNFSMPDVLSIALGGGSIVDLSTLSVGPKSVANCLTSKSISFGGKVLTLTDIAVSCGYLNIKNTLQKQSLVPREKAQQIYEAVEKLIKSLIVIMQGKYGELPVIFVGGGAALLPNKLFSERNIRPKSYEVANAYGAALAEISGEIDTVVSLNKRNSVLEKLHSIAREKAVLSGADAESLKLVEQQIIPYSYIPNRMARVRIKFSGKVSHEFAPVVE